MNTKGHERENRFSPSTSRVGTLPVLVETPRWGVYGLLFPVYCLPSTVYPLVPFVAFPCLPSTVYRLLPTAFRRLSPSTVYCLPSTAYEPD